MFLWRNKKNIDTFWLKKAPYLQLWYNRYISDIFLFYKKKKRKKRTEKKNDVDISFISPNEMLHPNIWEISKKITWSDCMEV